jgi:hypothetical protein
LGAEDQAAPHYQAAFRLSSGVTSRERLFILGSYYSRYLHDDAQALAAYRALVELYPDDYWGLNNLFGVTNRLGLDAETYPAMERIVALRPGASVATRGWLVLLCQYYVLRDDAKFRKYSDQLRRMRIANPGLAEWGSYVLSLDVAPAIRQWSAGNVVAAAQEMEHLGPRAVAEHDDAYTYYLAEENLLLGRARSAEQLCASLSRSVKRSQCLLRVAFARDDRNTANQLISDLRNSGSQDIGFRTLLISLWFGQVDAAKAWTTGHAIAHYMDLKGLWLLAEGYPRQASMALERDLPRLPFPFQRMWYRLSLAVALERQNKQDAAISTLADYTPPSEGQPDWCWQWPQYRMKLAELYWKTGRRGEAAQVARELLHYLSAGDPDLPMLAQLRAWAGS